MNKLSIIISVGKYDNLLKTSLDSIKNQSLGEIETVIISHNELPINSMVDIYNSMHEAINNINSEYILHISEANFIKEGTCELLYNRAKKGDLDALYVSIIDKNINKDELNKLNNHIQIISPFNYALFCKKSILDNLNHDDLFYEIQKKSKKIDYIDEKIIFRQYLNQYSIEKYTKDFLTLFPDKIDMIFTLLVEYLMHYPLNLKHNFYDVIKTYFELNNLNAKNQEIYNLISKNNIVDFFTEYKLTTLDYEIYESSLKKQDYKISIIIPIFNNETLIHRTLMSIENQTFGIENIEVLMINDASTDNTKNIINDYVDKNPNFKAIHIKNGTGSAGTPRNLGLKLSSAKYVIFIDHDDFFEIDALKKLYSKIIKYDCDFVYGTYVLINSNELIKFIYPNEKHGFFKCLEDNPRSITTPPSIWTKLFKKEFLEKNNILFPTILGEDAIFISKALKNANGIYYLWDEIICYYNLNESSYSTNLSYNYFVEGFTSEKYLYDLFNEWGQIKFYKIRGEGILDFYMNRILCSKLTNNEIINIFPLLYEFCAKLKNLNVNPKLEKNKIAFEYVVNEDINGFLELKNYKPNKLKLFSNKILNKINKRSFW